MTTGLPGGRPADLHIGIGEPGVPYAPMWAWQVARARAVAAREAPEAIVLVEHVPVYTLGRASDPANLLRDEASYRASGAEVHWIDRGGDATWHGPGQVTGYPILDLTRDPVRPRDIHRHVWNLEACMIDVAGSYGIQAERASGRPGIWVGDAKLAAIGIKVTRWVTFHGFGLNVSPDLAWFEGIVPCGLHGFGVTSLAILLGSAPPVREVSERLVVALGTRFGIDPGPETSVPFDR